MTKSLAAIRQATLPRRGLNREESAIYVGVSPTTFDEMVSDGRMPQPREASDGRIVWDLWELDTKFGALPHRKAKFAQSAAAPNSWDDDEGRAA